MSAKTGRKTCVNRDELSTRITSEQDGRRDWKNGSLVNLTTFIVIRRSLVEEIVYDSGMLGKSNRQIRHIDTPP